MHNSLPSAAVRRLGQYFFYFLLTAISVAAVSAPRARASTEQLASLRGQSASKLYEEGLTWERDSNDVKAAECYSLAISLGESRLSETDRIAIIRSYARLAAIYTFIFFDYPKAIQSCEDGMEMAREHSLTAPLPQLYVLYAGIMANYDHIRNPRLPTERTRNIFLEGIETSIHEKDWQNLNSLVCNFINLSLAHGRLENISEVADRYLASKDIPASAPPSAFTRELCLGVRDLAADRSESGIGHFRRCVEMSSDFKGAKDNELLAALSDLSYAYALTRDYGNAISTTEKLVGIARKEGMSDVMMYAFFDLSNFYRENGRDDMAGVYYIDYLQHKDSFLIASGMMDVDRVKALNQIKNLTKDLSILELRRQNQKTVIIMLSAILTMIVVLALIIILNYRKINQKNRALYQQSLELLESDTPPKQILHEKDAASTKPSEKADNGDEPAKYSRYNLSDNEKAEISECIIRILDHDPDIYSEDFSLNELAAKSGYKRNYISLVINETLRTTFAALLAKYRIREACRRLNSSDYSQYTIESIGRSVGYKSRSSFVTLFKRHTGMTPSEYNRAGGRH